MEKKTEKQIMKVTFIGIGLFLLWWIWQRRLANMPGNEDTVTPSLTNPQDLIYASNPAAFDPQDINITVSNQGLGYLSNQYIPLFGFVGMAQGVYYG